MAVCTLGLGLRLPLGVEPRNSWRIFGVAAKDVLEIHPGLEQARVSMSLHGKCLNFHRALFKKKKARFIISFKVVFPNRETNNLVVDRNGLSRLSTS